MSKYDVQCLIDKEGLQFFTVDVFYTGLQDVNFTTSYSLIREISALPVDAIAWFCPAFASPENFTQRIVNELPSNFNGTLWLQITNVTGCWDDLYKEGFLPFVELAVTMLKYNNFTKLGISTDSTWNDLLEGSAIKKSTLIDKLPLMYEREDNEPNFDDYNATTQIGDWKNPAMKVYSYYEESRCPDIYVQRYFAQDQKEVELIHL